MTSVSPIGGAPAHAATQAVRPARAGTHAEDGVRSAQPLDRIKLDALRSAIQAGRYPLDPAKLADKMMAIGTGGASK